MSIGTSASDAVGTKADVVGSTGSQFYNAVMPAVFMNTVLNVAQELVGQKPMMPGQGLGTALGTSAELYASGNTQLAQTALGLTVEAGVVGTLINLGTSSTYTPDQQKEMQAAEDLQKAEFAREDAQKQEAMAEEDRRRQFFAKKGPSLS